MRTFQPALIVVEATGGLEVPVAGAVAEAQAQALRARLTRRRPWVQRLTAERRRRHSAPQRIRADSQAHLPWRARRLARIDADLAAAIRSSPRWRATDEILPSRPGVGPGLARTGGAAVPAVGWVTRQELAALRGGAPFNGDRGTRRGTRVVWGGRAHARAVRYLSTGSAVRHNPVLKAFDERLRAAGKAAQVALTASRRKLLTILNAMVKHRPCWHANTA